MQKFFFNKILGNKLMYKDVQMPITIQPELKFNNFFSNDKNCIFTQLNLSESPMSNNGDATKETEKLIKDLSSGQLVSYTQNGTFLKGTAGIGYTLLKVYERIRGTDYLEGALRLFDNLDLYTVLYDNQVHIYAPTFNNIGLDLGYGISGVAYFSKEVVKTISREKVLI